MSPVTAQKKTKKKVKSTKAPGKILDEFNPSLGSFKSETTQMPYYEKTGFVLYNDDSLKVLAQLPENSVDMIFADPPYNLSNGGFTVHAGRMVSVNKGEWDVSRGFEDDYAFHYRWLEACRRVLKPHG